MRVGHPRPIRASGALPPRGWQDERVDEIAMPALAGLVGIALTGGFTLVGVHLGKRRDDVQWLRAERVRRYAAFLAEVDARVSEAVMALAVARPSPVISAQSMHLLTGFIRESRRLLNELSVIAPEDVYESAREYNNLCERLLWSHIGGTDPDNVDEVRPDIAELRTPLRDGELREGKNDLLRLMRSSLRGNLRW